MKPRNREINIFNMSLLDILCGALGAFCFLMLALFPYYAKGSGAGAQTDAANLRRELDQARAELQKALEQMSKMSQGQPGDIKQLMQQVERARKREQEALRHLQQLEQQLAQVRNKAQQQEKLANDLFGLTSPILVVSASWGAAKADVDLWIKNPDKSWEGPKKETPDGGKLHYQFPDANAGPATEQNYYPGASGRYEIYFKLLNRGDTPAQGPVPVNMVVTHLSPSSNYNEDKKLSLKRDYRSWNVRLVDENKLVPSIMISVDAKGMKVEPFPEKAQPQ